MNKTVNKIADTVTDIIRELLETTEQEAKGIVMKYLNKKSGTFDYAAFQNIQKPSLARELKSRIENAINLINRAIFNAKKIHPFDDKKILVQVDEKTKSLYTAAMKLYESSVVRIKRLRKNIPLRQAIFKQTQIGLDSAVRIATRRGTMGYKEYMEMAVRTNISTEIGEQQLKLNAEAKVVFYLSNVFRDSADDHAKYQGKYYYDKRYLSYGFKKETLEQIKKLINKYKMLSIQDARNKPPYLTTRPNCRHRLTPVSLKRVSENSPTKSVDDFKMSTGSYKKSNTKDVSRQRYLERGIRKYKARSQENQKLFEQTGDEAYQLQSKKDNVLVRKWQKELRSLIKNNNNLERDYRRETRNIIVNDLGVRYNL